MQVRFGAFTFDAGTRELRCGDEPVHLPPRAFDLLALLLRHAPNAMSKTDIHRELWPETYVSDGNLAVLIAEIRRAVGDSAQQQAFIRTVNRFGYAFVGTTSSARLDHGGPARGLACYVVWRLERFRLHPGDNILGRDLSADVSIDAVGVSRQHAAIDVGDAVVTLRDLSSKNGTFVDGARVTKPVALRDNVEVRLGAVRLHFRCSTLPTVTQTVEEPQDLGGAS